MISAVKHEFFRWVESLNSSKLTQIECKLLNLLVTHFDALEPLTTSKGSNNRATKINELIQMNHATLSDEFPDIVSQKSKISNKLNRITELRIGPFRGFATSESFEFDKKYAFMYGHNGSGKSSFCEGLEYALLGRIEEADVKRIAINEYIRNIQNSLITPPIAYAVNSDGQ